MRDKKNIIIIAGILFFVIMIIGVSYGYFVYNKEVANISLDTGDISINLTKVSGSINLNGSVSKSDYEGKNNADYIDFTINETVDTEDIKYEIEIIPRSGNTLDSRYVKLYLTDQQNNLIVSPYRYSELLDSEANNGKTIYQDVTIATGELSNVSKSFRLRAWISDDCPTTADKTFEFDIKLYAYNIDKDDYLKVNIDTNDGRSGLVKYAIDGSHYDFLPNPMKEGHTLDGWDVETTDEIEVIDYDFQYPGEYEFDGSNNINTGITLFDQANASSNFYISFNIVSRGNNNVEQAVLMGASREDISANPGMFFRIHKNGSTYQLSTRGPNNDTNIALNTERVEILRIQGVMYYRLNGTGNYTSFNNMSSFNSYHDIPVIFGSAYKNNAAYRNYKGVLSNMIVGFLDNDATVTDYENHFSKKNIPSTTVTASWDTNILYYKVVDESKTKSYIQSYDDVIENKPTYSTYDTVSTNYDKKTVYYYTGSDALENGNVLFAEFCWQIVRTTDTGSVRLLYNGVAANNQCKTNRTAPLGVNHVENLTLSMNVNRVYGRRYDYNLQTGKFTIQDTNDLPSMWNDDTYKELIGTYTCGDETTVCDTIYYIGPYQSSTQSRSASYEISQVANFAVMGDSTFNVAANSLAFVGYMFNNVYSNNQAQLSGTYANDVTWDVAQNQYVLSNDTSNSLDSTHHYICHNNDCTIVRYYFHINGGGDYHHYILLGNGKKIEDALKEMINPDGDVMANINVYNSSIKGYIDNWYKKNLTNYEKYLDIRSVYCSSREMMSLGGWVKTGEFSSMLSPFNNGNYDKNLACKNITDRFSVSNSVAKLTYPIGLLSYAERALMTTAYASIGKEFFTGGAATFDAQAEVKIQPIDTSGTSRAVNTAASVRGVITLRSDITFTSGDGGYETPYVIDTTS